MSPTLALTPMQAARQLQISKAKLYELLNSGEIPSSLLGPQTRRIRYGEIEAYLKRKEKEQAAQSGAA